MNTNVKGLYCIKCGAKMPVGDNFYGCPNCYENGERSSLAFEYHDNKIVNDGRVGIQKYGKTLPYLDIITLGEGNTPIISVPRLANDLDLKNVFIKNEFQNPTGSHKDRMSPLVIERAKELGKKVVVVASSGNAGSSLAAYAALAGLECKIIVTNKITPIYKESFRATGADLIVTETPSERWEYMKYKVETEGWYPVTNFISPPVGSNSFGVQGYKTVAYEIKDHFGNDIPEFIFIPVSRGDLLWGIYEGFKELLDTKDIRRMPKLVAIEPFKRISKVLDGTDYKTEFSGEYGKTESVGGGTVTYQSYHAVKESGGFAVEVEESEIEENVEKLSSYGFYLQNSSAMVMGAMRKAMESELMPKGSSALLIATSHGFKNMVK